MPQSYKIPQNVDLEDKIFGPLTLRQFLMALGAGAVTFVSFSIFYTALPLLFWLSTLGAWAAAATFIFIKPNEQSFTKYMASFVAFATKPNRRIWRRIPSLRNVRLHEATVPKVVKQGPSEDEVRSKLQKLAHVVDTRGWSEVDQADVSGRVTSETEAKPKLNIFLADEDQPEDILQAEDEDHGSDRTSSGLEQMLKRGVSKPTLRKATDIRHPQTAPAQQPPR